MKQGTLIFDEQTDRYDIRFDLADYYGGLHCGETFDVMVGGRWSALVRTHPNAWVAATISMIPAAVLTDLNTTFPRDLKLSSL